MRLGPQIALLLAGIVLLALLLRNFGVGELQRTIAGASPARFVVFLALSTAVFTTYALRWKLVLGSISAVPAELTLFTLFRFRTAEHAASTLVPAAHLSGEPLRALLLRRRGVDWATAIASVTMDRVLEMSASAVAGPLYVVVFFGAGDGALAAAPWIMGGMIAALAGLGFFYFHVLRGGTLVERLSRRGWLASLRASLETIDRSLREFVRSPHFATGLALSFLAEALVIAELWTLAAAFHLPITLPQLVGVMVGMGIAQLLPIPAALGSLEATQMGVLQLAGRGAELGLVVGLVVRVRETLWILVGLTSLWLEGLGRDAFNPPATS